MGGKGGAGLEVAARGRGGRGRERDEREMVRVWVRGLFIRVLS